MGVYLKEYLADGEVKVRISFIWTCMVLLLLGVSSAMFLKYRNDDLVTVPNGYGIWYLVILSMLLFLLLFCYAFKAGNSRSKMVIDISNSTLIAHSVSYISDDIICQVIKKVGSVLPFWTYFVCVLPGFLFSIFIGLIGNKIIQIIEKIYTEKKQTCL